ncbi:MAG: hypothetical protein OHK0046_14460 [Anaerolineae bacterium]
MVKRRLLANQREPKRKSTRTAQHAQPATEWHFFPLHAYKQDKFRASLMFGVNQADDLVFAIEVRENGVLIGFSRHFDTWQDAVPLYVNKIQRIKWLCTSENGIPRYIRVEAEHDAKLAARIERQKIRPEDTQ